MKDLTPRPCCHCGKDFTPKYTSMQIACTLRCAVSYSKKEREGREKAERAVTKARRKALETIPELTKKAQAQFNKWIRVRDQHKVCISCGAFPPDMSGFHAGRDAGHYRSVGAAKHLRFTEDNCHAQCVACNQWGAGKAVDYRIGLVVRIGIERVEALETNNTPHKWTREELRGITATYRAKLKELKEKGE